MSKLLTSATVDELAEAIAEKLFELQLFNANLSTPPSNFEDASTTNDNSQTSDASQHSRQAADNELIFQIENQLQKLGIPQHIYGYSYLRYGIYIGYKTPSVQKAFVRTFYPAIAEHFSTTTSRVERAIRHAIYISSVSGSETFASMFPYDKPTNKHFVSALINDLIMSNSCPSVII